MKKRSYVLGLVPVLFLVSHAPQAQQAQSPYPMADMLAQKIIAKYTNSTCVQLAEAKSEKPTGEKAVMEQRIIQALKSDPQMRQYFINKISAPIANKLFECGMIP
jgi:hypothetical protein